MKMQTQRVMVIDIRAVDANLATSESHDGYSAQDSIRNSHLQRDILDQMLQQKPSGVAFKFGTPTTNNARRYYYNLFLVDGYLAFRSLISRLDPLLHEFTGYYMIVVTSMYGSENSTLQQMIADLWALNIVNVVVVTANLGQTGESADILLYTYFEALITPYQQRNYFLTNPITKRSQLSGVEGNMLTEIAQRLNFSLHVVQMDDAVKWGTIYGNDTTSGAVKMVLEETVNLTVGSFSMRAERLALMKPSVSYYTIRVIFTVPPGRPYSAFEKLFHPFSTLTWMMISIVLLFGFAIIFVLKLSPVSVRHFVYGRTVLMPALNMVIIFFGGPSTSRTPGRNFARTLLFLWLYYCLVMRSLYQSSLFEYLQQKKNYTHLDSLRKLEAERIPYWMSTGAVLFVSGLKYVLKRTTFIANRNELFIEAFHRQSTNELRVAILATYDRVAYYNSRHYKRAIVHVVKDTVLRQPICLYFPKKSCLAKVFDAEIENIQMSGLFDYWLHQYVSDRFITPTARYSQPPPAMLTNEHLLGCYQTLLVLLGMAGVVFLLELLSTRCFWLRRLLEFLI
ncbi:uncharacterized protein LOC128746457 [Sabethes cyaneus]|uniref:uncharacterized protein LOC128746457 n=1 Tax=Sabethes cyaneus TaxID=53552 RepID=UPI00237DDF47|nr:uncharacterized protein LOC128746457 [Sabethes cyaneus]